MRRISRLLAVVAFVSAPLWAQTSRVPARPISYADVRPLLGLLRTHLPPELAARSPRDLESAWPNWVAQRNADVRARVLRGDEDSVVNLWLFGTSFTALPPARPVEVAERGAGESLAAVVDGRLDDLIAGMASPGSNGRLAFARRLIEGRGINLSTSAGKTRARALLAELGQRVRDENAAFTRAIGRAEAAQDSVEAMVSTYASLYQDRGLSTDTSVLSSFGVEAALAALKSEGRLAERSIQRVAIVGPGLDVFNKADGHDFYPEQTIQPFVLIDSLVRLGLSEMSGLSVTTFDLSARVNEHLTGAHDRARGGAAYLLQLPLSGTERWTPALLRFWETVGTRIGDAATPARVPQTAGRVRVRAIRVRPDAVARIDALDLNIVFERVVPGADQGLFDLVVATNVLAYYGTFEQALAVANIASMLRTGGSLLSNQAALPVPPMKPAVGDHAVVYSDRQLDHVFWYQRE